MFKRLLLALIGIGVLSSEGVRASESTPYSMVLLTENFPPFNMAVDGKNFAQENNIDDAAGFVDAGVRAGVIPLLRFNFRITVFEHPNHFRGVP